MTRPLDFRGRVAVITGAARGIGREEALELAARGAAVVINDLDDSAVGVVVDEIERAGGRALAHPASITEPGAGDGLVAAAVEAFGRLDILINNAGMLDCGYFEDLTDSAMDRVLDVNLRGVLRVTQPAWRQMISQGYGRILMTGSTSGLLSHHGLSNYAAAKGGVFGLSKALAYEGLRLGIGVNVLLPVADTGINASTPIPDWNENRRQFVSDEDIELLSTRRAPTLSARMGVYLVSEACTTTGEAFSAAHGRFARAYLAIGRGWLADRPEDVTVEAIADHIDEIRDSVGAIEPKWVFDEMAHVASRVRELDETT